MTEPTTDHITHRLMYEDDAAVWCGAECPDDNHDDSTDCPDDVNCEECIACELASRRHRPGIGAIVAMVAAAHYAFTVDARERLKIEHP